MYIRAKLYIFRHGYVYKPTFKLEEYLHRYKTLESNLHAKALALKLCAPRATLVAYE